MRFIPGFARSVSNSTFEDWSVLPTDSKSFVQPGALSQCAFHVGSIPMHSVSFSPRMLAFLVCLSVGGLLGPNAACAINRCLDGPLRRFERRGPSLRPQSREHWHESASEDPAQPRPRRPFLAKDRRRSRGRRDRSPRHRSRSRQFQRTHPAQYHKPSSAEPITFELVELTCSIASRPSGPAPIWMIGTRNRAVERIGIECETFEFKGS